MKNVVAIGHALVVCSLATGATAAPIISASGLDGAGLGLIPEQNGRAWGEMAFHTQDDLTILAPTFGVGFMPIRQLELSLVLPFSYASASNDSASAFGNLYLGANYVSLDGPARITVGLGVAAPTAPGSGEGARASALGTFPHGLQHMYLRVSDYTTIVVPLHLEFGGLVVGSIDASLQHYIPTGDNSDSDSQTVIAVAPGMGFYAGEKMVWGLRLPLMFDTSDEGNADDRTQVTVEPFARFNLGSQGFLGVRFNVPVDEPLTDFDVWGLHIGGGGAF